MSSKKQMPKCGMEVFYIPECNEIIVLKDHDFTWDCKKKRGKIILTYITRPYFGTGKLNKYKAIDFIKIGEI